MVAFKNEFTYRRFLEDGKEGEFDRLFDDAVERVRSGFMGKKHPMIIGGTEIFLSEQIEEKSEEWKRCARVFFLMNVKILLKLPKCDALSCSP